MKYFTFKELFRSSTADKKGIKNLPTDAEHIDNLYKLVEKVLDPIRELYGEPITVTSGYRCPALNKAVGGTITSQHALGQAADITVGSKEANKELFEIMKSNCPFDQLIDEKDYSWIHVSYREGNNRRQILHLK